MKSISRYWKTVVAAVIAVAITMLQLVYSLQEDGVWSNEDTLVTAIAFLGAVGVYFKANTPPSGHPSDPNISETAQSGRITHHGDTGGVV